MNLLKPILILILVVFSTRTLSAQGISDTTKITDGKTYMFLLPEKYECTGTVINHNEKDLMVNVKKRGIVEIHRADIRKIKEVGINSMKNIHALLSDNEIGFGYGVNSQYKISNSAAPYSQSIFSVNYKHYYLHYFTAGIALAIDYQTANQGIDNGPGTVRIKNNSENISLAPEVSICYFDKNKREHNFYVKIYSSFSLGLRYSRGKTDTTQYWYGTVFTEDGKVKDFISSSYQISPLCLRVGRSFAAFVELGYGYKGMVNFGIDIRSRYPVKPPSLLESALSEEPDSAKERK